MFIISFMTLLPKEYNFKEVYLPLLDGACSLDCRPLLDRWYCEAGISDRVRLILWREICWSYRNKWRNGVVTVSGCI